MKIKFADFNEVEVNEEIVRDVADSYRKLDKQIKELKLYQDSIKPILLDNRVEEFFLEDEEKVYFQEGGIKSSIDAMKVYKEVGLKNFMKVVKITETDLKKFLEEELGKEEQARILAKCKTIEGTKADTISVKKMTKKELKEMSL